MSCTGSPLPDLTPLHAPLAPLLKHASPARMRSIPQRQYLAFYSNCPTDISSAETSSSSASSSGSSSPISTSSGEADDDSPRGSVQPVQAREAITAQTFQPKETNTSLSLPPARTPLPITLSAQTHSSLAVLATRTTLALVSHNPPANALPATQLHRRLAPNGNTMLLKHHVHALSVFGARALNGNSITPSSPFVVMHALLLVHRILTSVSGASVGKTSFADGFGGTNSRRGSVANSGISIKLGCGAVSGPRSVPNQNCIPISLHSPARLLVAGLVLADQYSSDHPLSLKLWAEWSGIPVDGSMSATVASTRVEDMMDGAGGIFQIKRDALEFLMFDIGVGSQEFGEWCRTVRRWSMLL
ncbi:hypothetical protein BJ741DRAFT_594955 [Chytriomyces cf. hyalinus JEL632]|nr:hypothetical protein BJ741DRAFT_594955 [Chytriomyces cf. hyalinus JEL632]